VSCAVSWFMFLLVTSTQASVEVTNKKLLESNSKV